MKLDKVTRRRAVIILALAVVSGLFIWSNNRSLALQSGTADISTQEIPPPPSLDNQYLPYTPEILPTTPPINISKTVNLAKGLPDREVMVYIVKRSNGSFEKYFISIHDEDTRTELGLKPGDEIVFSNPLVILQSTPQIERVISKITDLAIGLPDKDKFVYVVQRLDGKYEQFVIPANYEGNVRELMGLKDGEKIVTGFALEPIRSTPIIDKPGSQFTPTPTVLDLQNLFPQLLNHPLRF